MKNVAAYVVEAKKLELREIPMPEVGDGDVLIEVKHVTICGSDMQFFDDPTVGGLFPDVKLPTLIGHECGGRVVSVGKDVKHLKPGDLVAVEPGIPCGHCEYCRSGRYNLCPDVLFMAAPPFKTGALQRYLAHPADFVFKLPEGMDTLTGAMMEPFSVGLHAVSRARVNASHTVAILGAGCIGMMTALACKAAGVRTIIMADLFDNRLEMAKNVAATHVINSREKNLIEAISELTDGNGVDVVFETAGNAITTAQTTKVVKRGGTIALVGTAHSKVDFCFADVAFKENNIVTVFRYRNTYPTAIKLAADPSCIDVKKVVTDIFPFEQSQQAFERALFNKRDSLKVAIEL